MSVFSSKKAEIMLYGFAILHSGGDVSALSREALKKL